MPRTAQTFSRALAPLALIVLLSGCAGGGGAGGSGGGGGQCNDGSWCGGILDRDHDNVISSQEWDDAFNRADTDGDGQLGQGEFEAAGGSWGGGGRGR